MGLSAATAHEPINGLDPEGIVEFRQVIERLHQEKGVTIFISSHILGELSKIATHYAIIKDGELIEKVSAQTLSDKRKNYLQISVDDATSALALLKKELHTVEHGLVSANEIHLFDVMDTGAVNRLLSSNDYSVTEIFLHQQDQEEYFMDLMGGTGNECKDRVGSAVPSPDLYRETPKAAGICPTDGLGSRYLEQDGVVVTF